MRTSLLLDPEVKFTPSFGLGFEIFSSVCWFSITLRKIANFKRACQSTIILLTLCATLLRAAFAPLLATGFGFLVLLSLALSQTPLWVQGADELATWRQALNPLSSVLLILTVLIILLARLARLNQIHGGNGNLYLALILTLSVLVCLTFTTRKILLFYLFFEGSLIPIFLIVIGWGYQPERLSAGFALFFYTLVASLPLLLILINFFSTFSSGLLDTLTSSRLYEPQLSLSARCLQLLTVLAFLVKLPIFMVHQWLPKAHVEAPVAGSIILAAVLLKLGGYGLCRLAPVFFSTTSLRTLILALILLGGGMVGLLCLRQTDIKVLIAYSSVSHMAFVAAGFLLNSWWAFIGALLMMIAHGVCSSGIFAGANVIYLRSNRRLLSLNKGVLGWLPAFTLLWFLLSLGNIGGPPTVNLVREIISITGIINFSVLMVIPISIITFLAAAYTLVLYRGTQHGEVPAAITSTIPLTPAERLILRGHVYWLFFLPLALPLFFYTHITI